MSFELEYSFGFTNIKNSVAFYNKNSVIFAAGKLCILLDLDSKQQTCLKLFDRAEVTAMFRSGNRIIFAIRGTPPNVCLFNPLSESKKFYLGPQSIACREFNCMAVSANRKFVAAQGGLPDWPLVIWLSQTRNIITILNPVYNPSSLVHDISFNAAGIEELVAVGNGVFKLYEYQEESPDTPPFTEHVFEKIEKLNSYFTIAWPQKENLAVGTSEGEILFFRGIDLIREISVINDVPEKYKSEIEQNLMTSKCVTSLIATSQHLICIFSGTVVLVYDGEEMAEYSLSKFIYLPQGRLVSNTPGEQKDTMDYLTHLIICPESADLVGVTSKSKLLRCCRFDSGAEKLEFCILTQQPQNEPIIDLDIACGRPLIASCSKHVVILWNYQDKTQEMRTIFRDEMSSLALHPSGLHIGLGFNEFCRIFSILHDTLKERKLISCKNCSLVRYSSGGHIFAIVTKSVIEVYSFLSLSIMFKLDGHAGTVTSLIWKDGDSKLVSCDDQGVICEWNLVTSKKCWENTAVLSYSDVDVNSLTGDIIALASDKNIRCLNNSFIRWELQSTKESVCIVLSSEANVFYTGTSNGCLISHASPTCNEIFSVNAHIGDVTSVILNFSQNVLISCGQDGCIFLWRTEHDQKFKASHIFSKLCVIDSLGLELMLDKSQQLKLSLQHVSSTTEAEYQLNFVTHEKHLRSLSTSHEENVDALNQKIASAKEEMQLIRFDTEPQTDVEEFDTSRRKEVINTTHELDKAYKLSEIYGGETETIVLKYKSAIASLNEEHATFSRSERNVIDQIGGKIKMAEESLKQAEEMNKQMPLRREEYVNKLKKEISFNTEQLQASQKVLIDEAKAELYSLSDQTERLKHFIKFTAEVSSEKILKAGEIDFDIKEKMVAVEVLEKDVQKLESALKLKEKVIQNQEKKFCQIRELVMNLEKCLYVSVTARGELMEEIRIKNEAIESCKGKMKKVEESLPELEEEIRLTADLCNTLTEKVGETIDGFRNKRKILHYTRDLITKYTSLLNQSISKNCNTTKLFNDITRLFEENQLGVDSEVEDAELVEEYDFQVDTLRKTYENIKNEPAVATRDKSMAEFRLAQENVKILSKVHSIQEEVEKQRGTLNAMEETLALKMCKIKSNKVTDALRDKIEFVIDFNKQNREERTHQIEKLDDVIEEQQKEIARFQKKLSAKLKTT